MLDRSLSTSDQVSTFVRQNRNVVRYLDCDCTEQSAIWSEIIHVISKLNNWLVNWLLQKKPWNQIGCCVLLIKSFLVGWKKEAIWGKKWCNSCIIHTDESQSDCKDHQWFLNECSKGKSQHFSPLSSYNLHNKDVLDYKKIIKVYWIIENILFMKTYHTCIAHLVNVRQITMLSK